MYTQWAEKQSSRPGQNPACTSIVVLLYKPGHKRVKSQS